MEQAMLYKSKSRLNGIMSNFPVRFAVSDLFFLTQLNRELVS